MSFFENITNNPIHAFIPALAIAILWFVTLLITLAVCFFKPKERTETWATPFFCGGNARNGKFISIVRIIFETPSQHHDISGCAISLELFEESKAIPFLSITVDSNRLKTYSRFNDSEPNKSVVRFLLHTNTSLESMDTIGLNLMSSGSLKVFNIEIQGIEDINSEANVAQIGEHIKRSSRNAGNDQKFPIMAKRFREIEESILTSRLLNVYEYILFIWMAINLICVFPSFLIICNGQQLICKDFDYDWLSTVYTGITSSIFSTIIFVVLISIYRYVLKYNIEKSFNSMEWNVCRYLYLLGVICIAVISAILPSLLVPNADSHSGAKQIAEKDLCFYWLLSVIIGILSFLLFWLIIVSIFANLCHFFSKTKQETDITDVEKTQIKDRTEEKKKEVMDKKDDSNKTMEEESEDYFKSLLKAGHKVKSISQYKGLNAKKLPQKPPKEDQSIGDTYFNEIMKTQGKVSSVSQYEEKNKNTN